MYIYICIYCTSNMHTYYESKAYIASTRIMHAQYACILYCAYRVWVLYVRDVLIACIHVYIHLYIHVYV